jgi:hypothetical protein
MKAKLKTRIERSRQRMRRGIHPIGSAGVFPFKASVKRRTGSLWATDPMPRIILRPNTAGGYRRVDTGNPSPNRNSLYLLKLLDFRREEDSMEQATKY